GGLARQYKRFIAAPALAGNHWCAPGEDSNTNGQRGDVPMKRLPLSVLTALIGVGLFAASPTVVEAQAKAPPGGAYKKVSTLVALPDFVPGLGTLYVDPATLP